MDCEICGKDIGQTVVLLPIKKLDGCLNTLACLACAEKSGAYCLKHQVPHLGFTGIGTACRWCIEEMVVEQLPRAEEIMATIRKALSHYDFNQLARRAGPASLIGGCTVNAAIIRFVATKTWRLKTSFDEVLKGISESGSIDVLFE